MNKEIEENFVKTFVEKRMQERIIFELLSDKKNKKNYTLRDYAIMRLAYCDARNLKKKLIHLQCDSINVDEVEKVITKLCGIAKKCYTMGMLKNGEMLLREALEQSFDWLGVSIVIIGDDTAFIKTETSIGSPTKFILHRK